MARPELRCSELPLLGEAERAQLLVEWNDTRAALGPEVCLHELVLAQAGRTPESVAVVFGERHLTYGALAGAASLLAVHLRGLGVGPEVAVGVFLERSLAMVVGLLGVLMAGGAYLPLEPSDPRERLAWMLADAAPRRVLSRRGLADRLPALSGARAGVAGRPGGGRVGLGGGRRRRGRGGGSRRGQPGLRDLHLRLDGPAEGRR